MKRLILLLLSLPLIGMDRIDPKNIQAQSKLGLIELYHDANNLYLKKDENLIPIERHQCDSNLRKLIALKKLSEFQKENGYISIKEMGIDNPELALTAKVRGLGGGPWLSMGVFLGCQVVGYTALFTGTMAANTLAPGAGGVATAAALGSGGVAAYIAGVNMWALKCSSVAFALPTP